MYSVIIEKGRIRTLVNVGCDEEVVGGCGGPGCDDHAACIVDPIL